MGSDMCCGSALEAMRLSKGRMREESDVRRVGCSAQGLRAVKVLYGVYLSFFNKEARKRGKGTYVEEGGYVCRDRWKDRRTTSL